MHIQFRWEEEDGEEGCLDFGCGEYIPRIGETVCLTYKSEDAQTAVQGTVENVNWEFDFEYPSGQYPTVWLKKVTTRTLMR
ncbi:MAG: hypothetical protein ACXABY_27485 [Candidatus Thorarchaeota archaeon]|jgi:hypothetical protein